MLYTLWGVRQLGPFVVVGVRSDERIARRQGDAPQLLAAGTIVKAPDGAAARLLETFERYPEIAEEMMSRCGAEASDLEPQPSIGSQRFRRLNAQRAASRA